MMGDGDDFESRYDELRRKIAGERGQLESAFQGLRKPVRQVEKGLALARKVREHKWAFGAGLIGIIGVVLVARWKLFPKKPVVNVKQELPRKEIPAVAWLASAISIGTNVWKGYQLYKRIQPVVVMWQRTR